MAGEIARRFSDRTGAPNSHSLTVHGASLHVEVRLSHPASTMLIIGGQPLPRPALGAGIIDTGASQTCIDVRALAEVGALPIRATRAITPAGLVELEAYAAALTLPEIGYDADFEAVTGIDLANLNTEIDGVRLSVIALIGRDVLERCAFVYDGPNASYALSMPTPEAQ